MANPNIVNVTSILGKTDVHTLTSAGSTLLTAGANTVVKVNNITVANINGVSAAEATINYYDGSTTANIISTVSVPADASLVVADKNTGFYIEENEYIGGSGTSADLSCIISYEIISSS